MTSHSTHIQFSLWIQNFTRTKSINICGTLDEPAVCKVLEIGTGKKIFAFRMVLFKVKDVFTFAFIKNDQIKD